MNEISEKSADRSWIERFLIYFLAFPLAAISLISPLIFVGLLSSQILVWMKEGLWKDRDFYWLISPQNCGIENYGLTYFQIKDACRTELQLSSGWIGVDKILKWLLELPVALLPIAIGLTSFLAMVLTISMIERIGVTKRHEENS